MLDFNISLTNKGRMFHRLGLIFILSDGRNIDLRTYLSTWPRGGITKEVFGDVDEYIQVNIRK